MKAKPFRIAMAGAAAATVVAVAGLAAGALAGELPKNMTWTA